MSASYYIQRGELKEFHRITRKALNFVFLMATPLFVYFIYFAKEGIFFCQVIIMLALLYPCR